MLAKIRYYDPETGRFLNNDFGIMKSGYAVINPIAFPSNMQSCFPSLPLSPEFKAGSSGTGWIWWDDLDNGWKVVIGVGVIAALTAATIVSCRRCNCRI